MEYNLYILKSFGPDGQYLYKFGYSSQINNRIQSYRSSNPFIQLVSVHYHPDGLVYEQKIHKKYPAVCMNEWYDEDTINKIIAEMESDSCPFSNVLMKKEKVKVQLSTSEKIRLRKTVSFQTIAKEYADARDNKTVTDTVITVDNDNELVIIKDFYEMFGHQKMKALEYRKKDMTDHMIAEDKKKQNDVKIVQLLNLRVGEWVSAAQLKVKLAEIYDKLNIDKVAKATDIEQYYGVNPQVRWIDGKSVKGFSIILSKIKVR